MIAVAQRRKYLHLLSHVGIDHAFSPRMVAVKEIEEMLAEGPTRRLSTLAEGIIDVYQIRVGKGAEVVGKPLRETELAPDLMIAAAPHDGEARLPGPDDSLQPGDTVLVIGRQAMEKKLEKIFATRQAP